MSEFGEVRTNSITVWKKVGDTTAVPVGLVVFNGRLYMADANNLYLWDGNNALTSLASNPVGESIVSIIVYNNHIYCGTAVSAQLYEWDGGTGWTMVANTPGAELQINDMIVYNNRLYGCTSNSGLLVRWNDVNAWTTVAGAPGTNVTRLCIHAGQLFGLSSIGGYLYRWNNNDVWEPVAYGGNFSGDSLVSFNGNLYAGLADATTPLGAKLCKWNGGRNSYEDVLILRNKGNNEFSNLLVYNNELFLGTHPDGLVYRWSGSGNMVEVTQLGDQTTVICLTQFGINIYAGGNSELWESYMAVQKKIKVISTPTVTWGSRLRSIHRRTLIPTIIGGR